MFWALVLFWLTIVLGLIKLGRTLSLPAGPAGHSFTVFTFVAVYSLMTLVTIYLAMGASWARGAMLILFIIGILPALPLVFAHFAAIPLAATLTCAQGLAQIVGLYLVFREPAASWFGRPIER
ncbi:hypothetical protein C41B8_11820 [Salinisphaera hydrothermalis C41B8]|uniref:Uncharacterized protein n=1 Tax=Salinisphaera hydrothermalis (strain C41B8) TaxID=1304275 RepID=A0A084IJW8_SALHC|nr:hypothetical protein C41B8_11820 [Salinisphaera hydrothermalis C41B8]